MISCHIEEASRLFNLPEGKLLETLANKGGGNEVTIDMLCITPMISRTSPSDLLGPCRCFFLKLLGLYSAGNFLYKLSLEDSMIFESK